MTKKANQQNLGKRIRERRKGNHLTLVKLSQRIGISNQALSAIERGEKNPSKQTLMNLSKELADGFGIPWLEEQISVRNEKLAGFFDERGRQNQKDSLKDAFNEFLEFKFGSSHSVTAVGIRSIPLIGKITAGRLIEQMNGEEKIPIPARMTRPGRDTFGVVVEGEAIHDALVNSGDIIVASEFNDLIDGKFVILEIKGEVFLKRISLKGRKLKLLPFSNDYDPIDVKLKEINPLAEITGLLRFIE